MKYTAPCFLYKTWRFAITKLTSGLLKIISKYKYINSWHYSYLKTLFITSNISIITLLCTMEFYLQTSRSNSFNKENMMVLLNCGSLSLKKQSFLYKISEFTFLLWGFYLCLLPELCHYEIDKVKASFKNISYPKMFIDFSVKKCFDKYLQKRR